MQFSIKMIRMKKVPHLTQKTVDMDHFFSNESSWTPKPSEDHSGMVWLSFWCSTRPFGATCSY